MKLFEEKNRLATLLIAILVLGFLTTSLLSYWMSSNAARQDIIEQRLPLTSDSVYSEIQRDLLRPINISQQMASDTFVKDWLLAGEKDPQAIIRYLGSIKEQFSANSSFLVSERSSMYYHPTDPPRGVSEKVPTDAWYYRVRSMQEPYEINLDIDKANRDTLTAFINYRISDYDGKYLAVTGVGIALGSMKELMERYEKKFKRRVFFVDQSGKLMLAGKAMDDVAGSIQNLPGRKEVASQILNLSKTPVQSSYAINGVMTQVNSRFIPELKWYLIVEESESDSGGKMHNTLWLNLLISALVTALVVGLTLFAVNQYQKRLEHVATTDMLSGLANREMGNLLFEQAAKDTRRLRQPMCVALLDIDHFKRVNDNCGHLAGDETIRKLGQLLTDALRRNDLVARWGGEEFMLVLKGCNLDDAQIWLNEFRRTVEKHDFGFTAIDSETLTISIGVTVSIGVTLFEIDESRDKALARADAALYKAKGSGRNKVVAA